jgi:hypothetical protein
MTTDIVRFKDFTPDAGDPPTFAIYDVTYVCLADIPLDSLADMATFNDVAVSSTEKVAKMVDFLVSVLTDETGKVFRENTARGSQHPIGVRTIQQLVPWLMEQYGLRPTQESSESSDGSADDDGNLTGGA